MMTKYSVFNSSISVWFEQSLKYDPQSQEALLLRSFAVIYVTEDGV